MCKKAFTLIELLVVVAIMAILMAILLPSLGQARDYARRVICGSNNKEIALALDLYSKDFEGLYPLAWSDQKWEITADGPGLYDRMGWMRRLFPYVQQEIKVYKCPSFARATDRFTYFLGCRAAYAKRAMEGYTQAQDLWSCVRRDWIEFPSAYVLGGDCNRKFDPEDCDRDDFTQPCLGFTELAQSNPDHYWEPWHGKGLMVIFGDSHVKWYDKHVGRDMTYSYNDYTDWLSAIQTK